MALLVSGAVTMLFTGILFWRCLPDGEQMHRFVGTEWEPYVGVAFCSGIALSFTMILSGVLGLVGAQ